MGQKVNPHGARVGVILDWFNAWYARSKHGKISLYPQNRPGYVRIPPKSIKAKGRVRSRCA